MCIALLFLQPRHCSGMAGQRHSPAALLPGKKILVTHCREDPEVFGKVYSVRDRLCGLVVRVSGYRYRGPGFDPRRYQIF